MREELLCATSTDTSCERYAHRTGTQELPTECSRRQRQHRAKPQWNADLLKQPFVCVNSKKTITAKRRQHHIL